MIEYWNPMVPELLVSDFAKSYHFYTEILGFSVRIRRSHPDFVYLEQGQTLLMLEQVHDKAWLTGDMTAPFGRGVNFQMELPSLNGVLERLKLNQTELYRDVQESWYDIGEKLSGQREFLVQDPDGYLLRFTQHIGEKLIQ